MANKVYGVGARVGLRFHEEVKDIQLGRIVEKTSKELLSMEKISNLIVRHKDFKNIKKDIIELREEELNGK